MRLSRISIENHSRIQDLKLEIRRHAVVVGANDVGKSSILRMLNLLLGASTAALYQEIGPEDFRDPTQPLVVNAMWVDFEDEERRGFPSEISINTDFETEYLWVQLTVHIDPDNPDEVSIRRWFPESGHQRSPSREQIQAFGWRYLRATRGSSIFDGPHSPVRALLAAVEADIDQSEMRNLLQDFNEALSDSAEIKKLLLRISQHLSRSMPRAVSENDLVVRSLVSPSGDVLEGVSLYLNRDDAPVPLTEQSDGLRQLMAMTLFDLAEGAANVVAIDEPEIHLHPTSQRTAAELLSGDGNQKIIVTHSPYILHRFDPSEVIAIDRLGKCHQVGRNRLTGIDKLRAHWWSPRLLEALTSRFVLVVEGDADRVIVEAVAAKLGIDLDRLGATVIELDGADKFKNVFPILGPDGFGPTLLGLVDEAESSSWIGVVGGKPGNVENKQIFVSHDDLEAEYCRAFGGPALAEALVRADFCNASGLCQSAGVEDIGSITPEALAKFCRKKGKVEAAAIVAENLTDEVARKIESVACLVQRVEELSRGE